MKSKINPSNKKSIKGVVKNSINEDQKQDKCIKSKNKNQNHCSIIISSVSRQINKILKCRIKDQNDSSQIPNETNTISLQKHNAKEALCNNSRKERGFDNQNFIPSSYLKYSVFINQECIKEREILEEIDTSNHKEKDSSNINKSELFENFNQDNLDAFTYVDNENELDKIQIDKQDQPKESSFNKVKNSINRVSIQKQNLNKLEMDFLPQNYNKECNKKQLERDKIHALHKTKEGSKLRKKSPEEKKIYFEKEMNKQGLSSKIIEIQNLNKYFENEIGIVKEKINISANNPDNKLERVSELSKINQFPVENQLKFYSNKELSISNEIETKIIFPFQKRTRSISPPKHFFEFMNNQQNSSKFVPPKPVIPVNFKFGKGMNNILLKFSEKSEKNIRNNLNTNEEENSIDLMGSSS